jgi:SAM-dependent methyltransferase
MTFLDATRAAYDTIAPDYAERFRDGLASRPVERAVLGAFAELVPAGGLVADLGSGPGHITAHLHALGLPVFGLDLSPHMVAVARERYPGLRFDEGSMTALDLADGSLGGIVAWYSIIHIPPDLLSSVFAQFHRVLAPGGQLLLAFQVGDRPGHRDEAFGYAISLDYYLRQPELVASFMEAAGLVTHTRVLREPAADGLENAPRAYLLASKSASI